MRTPSVHDAFTAANFLNFHSQLSEENGFTRSLCYSGAVHLHTHARGIGWRVSAAHRLPGSLSGALSLAALPDGGIAAVAGRVLQIMDHE